MYNIKIIKNPKKFSLFDDLTCISAFFGLNIGIYKGKNQRKPSLFLKNSNKSVISTKKTSKYSDFYSFLMICIPLGYSDIFDIPTYDVIGNSAFAIWDIPQLIFLVK